MDHASYDKLFAHGMLHWCVPPVDGRPTGEPAGDGLTCTGKIADDHLRACYQLWTLWNVDRGEGPVDDGAFVDHWIALLGSLCGYVNIVWDGSLPVGVSDCVLFRDPLTGKWTFHGDHAYVLPDYRRQGALKLLYEAATGGRDYFGCERGIAPTEWADPGPRSYYLSQDPSWTPTTLILTWEAPRS